ncbi:MAG: lysophospholipid acyltransferase family protein [Ignavibacteria bacterium]|jgi:chlorobactene lauroyltransferase
MTKLTTRPVDFVPARPDGLSKLFWRQYFLWSIKRHFHTGFVSGEEHIQHSGPDSSSLPTIFACTHGSWWDAALTIELSLGQYKLSAYGMMEYKQLRKYSFFSRIGMFSVVREDATNALYSIRYGADLIRGSQSSLWMFPQGTLIHQDVETISCEPGIGILASLLGRCRIVPVALRYEHLREQRPSCWVRFGAPYLPDESDGVRLITKKVSERMTEVRDLVRADAMTEDSSAYRTFLRGSMSMEKRFDKLMRR